MPISLLIALYIALCLAPLGLSALRIAEPRHWTDELASGAGMVAFSMILIEFLLSGRFRVISRQVGMDVTMRLHQLLARTALVFALVHPFLYTSPMNPPLPWDPTRQFTIAYDLESLGGGIAAFLFLPSLVALAIGRKDLDYGYETWRLIHGIAAAAVALLLLHHVLHAGRYGADPVVAAFWIGLSGLAIASLLNVYLLRPALEFAKPWRLTRLDKVADRTWDVEIEPEGHAGLRYEAGQFLWLNIGSSSFSLNENPFSISSAPSCGPSLRFLIKELGDFTGTLGDQRLGTRAYVDGAYGNLTIAGSAHPGIVLLAGGVGLAPLIGILRELDATGDPRPRILVYGNRTEAQIAHRDELDGLARSDCTTVRLVLSEPPDGWSGLVGRIDAATLSSIVTAGRRDWLFLICGPSAMIEASEHFLSEAGVPVENVVSERFDYD